MGERSGASRKKAGPGVGGGGSRRGRSRLGGNDPLGARLRAGRGPSERGVGRYFAVSQQPLHILIFLAPLILVYELGTWRYATGAAVGMGEHESLTISAYKMLVLVFDTLGASGLYLPGLALVVVLATWHVLRRDTWQIHIGVPLVMLLESALLALPLIVFDQLFTRLLSSGGAAAMQVEAGGTAATLGTLSWQARLTLSVGAGLYEELVFRMILIALVHAICVDIGRMKAGRGAAIALAVSAIAFAAYHRDVWSGPGLVDVGMLSFYLVCGLYFGCASARGSRTI